MTIAKVNKKLVIDVPTIKTAASVYRAIYHPLRLQMIELIHKAGKTHVTPLIKKLKLEQSLVSAQLKILRDSRVVTVERQGQRILYSVNHSRLNQIGAATKKLVLYKLSSNAEHPRKSMLAHSSGSKMLLTPAELKVVRLVCKQNTTDEIAEKMKLSKRTVDDYRAQILKKFKARNSVGILAYAVRHGLFKL